MGYEFIKLSNEIPVITDHQPQQESVTLVIVSKLGSCLDGKHPGLAHFYEHMLLKGTNKYPTLLTLRQQQVGLGASVSFATSPYFQKIFLKIEKKRLVQGVAYLSELILNSLFRQTDVDSEVETIVHECNDRQTDFEKQLIRSYYKQMFPGHFIAEPVLGKETDVRNIKSDTLHEFRTKHLVSGNMLIGVVGDTANIIPLLEDNFAQIPNKETSIDFPDLSYRDLRPQNDKLQAIRINYPQPTVTCYMGFNAYPKQHSYLPAARMLNIVLGRTIVSRLFLKLRDELGLCYALGSCLQELPDIGEMRIIFRTRPSDFKDCVLATFSEVENLKKELITVEELDLFKNYSLGNLTIRADDLSAKIDNYAVQQLLQGNITTYEAEAEEVQEIDVEQLKVVANDLFNFTDCRMSILAPELDIGWLETI